MFIFVQFVLFCIDDKIDSFRCTNIAYGIERYELIVLFILSIFFLEEIDMLFRPERLYCQDSAGPSYAFARIREPHQRIHTTEFPVLPSSSTGKHAPSSFRAIPSSARISISLIICSLAE